MALHGQKNENPFCPLMARTNGSCAAWLEVQEKIASGATDQPKTAVCFAGLTDATVPLRVGERLIGFLQTGQVMLQLLKWGLDIGLNRAEEDYFHTKILSPDDSGSRKEKSFRRPFGVSRNPRAANDNGRPATPAWQAQRKV